nr:MAG TPA: hypothetical protein [Caudoviricetes sp.]
MSITVAVTRSVPIIYLTVSPSLILGRVCVVMLSFIIANFLFLFNNAKQTIIIQTYKCFDNFFLSIAGNLYTFCLICIFAE